MFKQMPLKKLKLGLLALVGLLAAALLPATVIGRPELAPATAPAILSNMCTPGPTFNLETRSGYMQTPDGNSLFMWTYARSGSSFQVPSPVLCVNEGDTVTINLTNNLPEAASIVFPGQNGVTASGGLPGLFTAEAEAGGGMVSYSFVAGEPGTYLYQVQSKGDMSAKITKYGIRKIKIEK